MGVPGAVRNLCFGARLPRGALQGFPLELDICTCPCFHPPPPGKRFYPERFTLIPVYAATEGWKSEHVVVCFQIPGCFWGKRLIWGKGKGIYILGSNLDIGTIQWGDLRTTQRLTGAPGERGNDFIYYKWLISPATFK